MFAALFNLKDLTSLTRCLVIFHSHLLRRSGLSESSCTQSPSRPLIAIQALTRMFQANGSKMSSVQAQVYQQPPFLAHMVYLGLVLHVKVGRVGDDKEWDAYFEHLVGILTILKRKWKLAGKWRFYTDGSLGFC